jgi:dynein heavy chain
MSSSPTKPHHHPPKKQRPEVNEREVFLRYDLLAKRLGKLAAMFTTVDQIADLAAHSGHIAGLGAVLAGFGAVVDDVRRKPYDLLDWRRTEFDRDFLDFNVNAHDLDTQMQAFVDASFGAAASTDHALSLLAQFQAVLQRDALRQQLEEKWGVAFQHYARDLEAVQAAYETHKHKPPLPRNAPPIVRLVFCLL